MPSSVELNVVGAQGRLKVVEPMETTAGRVFMLFLAVESNGSSLSKVPEPME